MSGFNENEHLFLDDDNDILPTVSPEYHNKRVEYDGMTIRLRVHAFVTPGDFYNIKIVIADTDGAGNHDDFLDSALFISTSSVRTIAPTP